MKEAWDLMTCGLWNEQKQTDLVSVATVRVSKTHGKTLKIDVLSLCSTRRVPLGGANECIVDHSSTVPCNGLVA